MKKKPIINNLLLPRENTILFGHHKAKEELQKAFDTNKASHSWIISGAQGIGKATFIYNFIKEFFVKTYHDDYQKKSILTQVTSGNYGNLLIIEKNLENKEIIVDQIRQIKKFFYLSSSSDSPKIVIIDSVDELNINACNALLKVLEEPQNDCYLFLINHVKAKLLPTIKSRCRMLKMTPLDKKTFTKILVTNNKEIDIGSIDSLFYLSDNSPGLALEMSYVNIFGFYEQMLEILVTINNHNLSKINKLADMVKVFPVDKEWKIFSILINHLVAKLIKTLADIEFQEIINQEKEILNKISKKMKLDNLINLWDNQQRLLKETIQSNLDQKQILLILLNAIREC